LSPAEPTTNRGFLQDSPRSALDSGGLTTLSPTIEDERCSAGLMTSAPGVTGLVPYGTGGGVACTLLQAAAANVLVFVVANVESGSAGIGLVSLDHLPTLACR